MSSIHKKILASAVILFALAASTSAGEFSDTSGFSFTYPTGWVPVNRAAMGDPRQILPAEIRSWMAKNNVDLSSVAVILLRSGQGEFLENLNVVVDKRQQIPVSEDTVQKLTEMLPKQYQSMGIKISNLTASVEKVGGRDAIVAQYRAKMPNVPFLLHQKQVMFPGDGKTYTVTCTSKLETQQQFEATFDKMLASFKIPEPAALAASPTLDYTWIGAAVGGLIGAVGWLLKGSR